MPWRKRYDPDMSIEDKAQRAYEVGPHFHTQLTADMGYVPSRAIP